MGNRYFFISIIFATLIHGVLIFSYFYHTQNNEGAIAQGEDGLLIGVGISGSYTDNINESKEDIEIIEKNELSQKIEESEVEEAEIEEKLEIEPEVEVVEEKKIEAEAISNLESKAKVKIESKPKPKPKVEVKPKPKQELKTEKKLNSEINLDSKNTHKSDIKNLSKKAQASRRATGVGSKKTSGGNPGATQEYLSIVKARISRAKKYPRSARREGIVGTSTVRFLIKLSGKVKNIKLIKSSGDERLDKEAFKMLKRASPFPSIPSDVSKEPLDLTLPIEFTLKTIKNKFY